MVDGPNIRFSPKGGHSELPGGQGDKTSQRGTVSLRGGRLTPMCQRLEGLGTKLLFHCHDYVSKLDNSIRLRSLTFNNLRWSKVKCRSCSV